MLTDLVLSIILGGKYLCYQFHFTGEKIEHRKMKELIQDDSQEGVEAGF